jgi:lipid A 3-O-deacylase
MTQGTWELGVFGGGGSGLGYAYDTHFVYAGGRAGLILSKEHLPGWARGNFEWAVDIMPLYTVYTPTRAVYGGSFRPAVWIWNFTMGEKVAPYAAIAGGILFTTRDIPPGNTSWVNFTPEAAFGANIFLRQGRALRVEGAYVHHSNADLGTQNPGYNAALFFTIGFSWFHGGR